MSSLMANVTATRSAYPTITSYPLYPDDRIMTLEADHERDTMYCGSRFQLSTHKSQKTRHATKPLNTNRAQRPSSKDQNHGRTIQHHTSSAMSISPPSAHHQRSGHQQHANASNNPTSLYKANTSKPRAYLPPPATKIYQLDRFLDELSDFGSLSLAGEVSEFNGDRGRQGGATQREKEMRRTMRVLVRRIEV